MTSWYKNRETVLRKLEYREGTARFNSETGEFELFGSAAYEHKTGQQLKQEGMDLAAQNNAPLLDSARDCAIELGKEFGLVTSDLVAKHFVCYQMLGPSAGSIFRGKCWHWTGKWVPSTRPVNHARMLRVWRYVEKL